MFDTLGPVDVAELTARARPAALAGDRTLPVVPGLASLLPEGLRRGSTLSVGGPGATSLALALLAGPSGTGSWCAVVGMPDLGPAAAAELGVDLGRLGLVPEPGERWAAVAAALVDAVDVVLLGPRVPVRHSDARRLAARARRQGSVLVVAGRSGGEPCDVDLVTAAVAWEGLGPGHGHLTARQVEATVGGRRGASRPRRARLWLPGPDGGVAPVEPAAATPAGPRLVATAG